MTLKSIHPIAAVVLLFGLLAPLDVSAQGTKKKAEPITGTVVSIEKAKTGKNYVLKVKDSEDTEYDTTILPRTQLIVTAKGDEGFMKPGMNVHAKVTELGQLEYVAEEVAISFGLPVQSQLTPITPGNKDDGFQMTGKILLVKENGNAEGRHFLNVQCGGQTIKVNYTSESPISVKLADAAQIKEGDAVEIDGTINKTKKQIVMKALNVTSAEPISSEEYLATLQDSKKSKTAKSTTAKSKSTAESKSDEKSKTDDKPAAGEGADPFGVLKGKKAAPKGEKSEKSEKSEKTPAKTEKSDSEKKPE